MLTIKTDKQRNFLKAKARWVLWGFRDKQKEYHQTDSPTFHKTWDFRMSCQMAASKSENIFSHWSWDSFPSSTVWKCESWCCVSIATRCRSPSFSNCEIEETCLLHDCCTSTLVERFGQGTLLFWYDPYASWPMLLCICTQPKRVSQIENKKCSTQVNGTDDISLESCVRSEGDVAFEKMLDPIEGSPATDKSVAGILNLFCRWSFWNR